MQSFQFYGPSDIRLTELPKPELTDGEILVKVEAALTGGTDVKTYLRGHPRIIKTIPSAFGYEFSGVVSESLSESFKVGDRVVSANTAPCYECFFCKKKEFELCENLEFLNGSFAEYIKIPASIVKHNTYKLPDNTNFKLAACSQTLAVALHGFEKSQIQDGDIVCVYGIGAIGQCFIKLCKQLRKRVTVITIGSSELKIKLAQGNGADHIINYKTTDTEAAVKAIAPYGCDVVIEAVGQTQTWAEVFKLVRPGGLINFFGGCPKGTKVELDTFQAHYQELRTVGVFHHRPEYIKQALDLISTNTIKMEDLISHEMSLEKLEDALKMMISGEALKVVLRHSTIPR